MKGLTMFGKNIRKEEDIKIDTSRDFESVGKLLNQLNQTGKKMADASGNPVYGEFLQDVKAATIKVAEVASSVEKTTFRPTAS